MSGSNAEYYPLQAAAVTACASEMGKEGKSSGLEALRGFLCLYVLAGHARWLLWIGHAQWTQEVHHWGADALAWMSAGLRYGHEAVMVFFALSGFVIHRRSAAALLRGGDPRMVWREFFVRRLWRLGPPYLLALLLTVGCDWVGGVLWPELYEAQTGDGLLDHTASGWGYGVAGVLAAACMVPGALGRGFGSNGPLWSLGCEVVYYLAYPAWLAVRRRQPLLAFGVLPLLMLLPGVSGWGWLGMTLSLYPLWILGAGLSEWDWQGVLRKRGGLLAVGSVILGVSVWLCGGGASGTRMCGYVALCSGVLAWTVEGRWRGSLIVALGWLGERSYSVYVCHFPLLVLLSAFCWSRFGGRPGRGWMAVGGSIGVLGACCLLYWVCERRVLARRVSVRCDGSGPGGSLANEAMGRGK